MKRVGSSEIASHLAAEELVFGSARERCMSSSVFYVF